MAYLERALATSATWCSCRGVNALAARGLRPPRAGRRRARAAACSCAPRRCATSGCFDEAYFAYHEDVDWCLRAQRAGYQVYYEPFSRVYHHGSRSTGQLLAPAAGDGRRDDGRAAERRAGAVEPGADLSRHAQHGAAAAYARRRRRSAGSPSALALAPPSSSLEAMARRRLGAEIWLPARPASTGATSRRRSCRREPRATGARRAAPPGRAPSARRCGVAARRRGAARAAGAWARSPRRCARSRDGILERAATARAASAFVEWRRDASSRRRPATDTSARAIAPIRPFHPVSTKRSLGTARRADRRGCCSRPTGP